MSVEPCRECAPPANKHAACDGQTWDHERDEPGVCPCWLTHTKED